MNLLVGEVFRRSLTGAVRITRQLKRDDALDSPLVEHPGQHDPAEYDAVQGEPGEPVGSDVVHEGGNDAPGNYEGDQEAHGQEYLLVPV